MRHGDVLIEGGLRADPLLEPTPTSEECVRLLIHGQRRRRVVGAAGSGAVSGLDLLQELEASQRGRRLAPHSLAADQRLQPHQALERVQRLLSRSSMRR